MMQTGEQIKKSIDFWLEKNFDQKTKEAIIKLQKENPEKLIDAFYRTLSFGTGGLRGVMGVGPNRMNDYTVGWATKGLANYLKKTVKKSGSLKVAISYDSRHNAKAFALDAARVLAASDIEVYLFKELRPTPLVSFLCRYKKCDAAIMVTASHNPPEYNGYKVYWSDGAQVVSPHDKGIIEEVTKLHDPDECKKALSDDPRIHFVGDEIDSAYLDAIKKEKTLSKHDNSISILYSSLHGTGVTVMPQALQAFGFTNIHLVEKQCVPDGDFPTCKRPNPEEKEALTLGIEEMLQNNHDIFIATDPDADRVGVVLRDKDRPYILNGNQIACLLCYFLIKNRSLSKNAAFVKTIVTSELFQKIAESKGASCFNVLTGFKYIAEKIRSWEKEKSYQFIMGAEESYGYLVGDHVRDKDAIITSCVLAEACQFAKEQGKTLVDILNEMYEEFGNYLETLISIQFPEGKKGQESMAAIMQSLRDNPPKRLLDSACRSFEDLLNEKTGYPKADVLILTLDDATKIIVRPSGTEPKVKVYLMLSGGSLEALQMRSKAYKKEIENLFRI